MSVIHPGSSINFDAAALRQNEDEEMREEEMRQQKELRELLSAELSDDLLDDDRSSVNDSHRSLPHDASPSMRDTDHDPTEVWLRTTQGNENYNSQQDNPSQYFQSQMNEYNYNGQMNPYRPDQYNHHPQQFANYDQSYPGMPPQIKQWQAHGYSSGMPFTQQRDDGVGQYVEFENDQENLDERYEDSPDQYPFPERGEVEGREDYEGVMDGHQMQQYLQYKPQPAPASSSTLSLSPSSKLSYRQSFPPHSSLHGRKNNQQHFVNDVPSGNLQENYESRKTDNSFQKQFSNVTQDIREEGGRQMAQLQILYKARGKRIDELTQELDELKKDSAREKRILNHQLAMAKDQKDGMCTSLEESQALVQTRDRFVEDLTGKIKAQQGDIESLKSAKNELMNKLQISERTVESLHEQLSQMNHSDAIERARDQHDAVLSAANDRHELHVLELTTQLDDLRQQKTDVSDELEKVRFQLNRILRESEQTLLDKTETINRLTKSLETAQTQCQGLLTGSSNNAFNQLQYADSIKEKKENEEEIAVLRMRLHDAEEHLKLFENAMQLGAGGTGALGKQTRSSNLSESFRDLMNVTKKLDWNTPQTENKEYEPGSREELIDGLRRELERALTCNKSKRDQVTKMKQQCDETEQELIHWRSRADEAQVQLKLHSGRDMKHDESLTHNLQELEERAEAAEDEVSRLEKVCAETKQRMAEMIQQHDQDKQDAVDRCERACMQLHSDAKQVLRDELTAENEQKIYELTVDHDGMIRELNDLIGQMQSELHDVKQSYVHVCAEKDNIPESLRHELLREFEEEKATIISEHKKEMLELEKKIQEERDEFRMQLRQEHDQMLKDSREEWEEEREKDFDQQVETKIALAKVSWFEEFANSKLQAIKEAARETEDRWQAKIQSLKMEWVKDKEAEIHSAVQNEKESWISEKNEELEALRAEMQNEKVAAVKTASSIAELNLAYQRQSMEGQNQEAIESKLQEAHDAWKMEQDRIMESARSLWQQEQEKALCEAKKESEKKLERVKKEHQSLIEKAVAEFKKKYDYEQLTTLKQKSIEMEKEIAKLQEQHRRDYERFVEDHKKTLSSFLEKEKNKACVLTKDAAVQIQVQNPEHDMLKYEMEKNQLTQQFREEMNKLEDKHNARCEELSNEIRELLTKKNDLVSELQRSESRSELEVERAVLSSQHELSRTKLENERLQGELKSSASKIQAMTQQNKDDISRLKERMRDEYRRWKKERSSLVAKVKDNMQHAEQQEKNLQTPNASSNCKLCQTCAESNSRVLQHKDDASKKAFSELSDMYVQTLAMIKNEVMSFLGESRGRTRDTLSQERKRVAARVRSHYSKALHKIKPEREVDAQLSGKLQSLGSDSGQGDSTPMLLSERDHSLDGKHRGRQMPSTYSYERRLPADPIQRQGRSNNIPVRMIPDRDVGTPGVASEPRYRAPYRSQPTHHSLTRITTRERPLHDEDRLSEGHGAYSSNNHGVRSNLLSYFQGCENVPQRVHSDNNIGITDRLFVNHLPRELGSPR